MGEGGADQGEAERVVVGGAGEEGAVGEEGGRAGSRGSNRGREGGRVEGGGGEGALKRAGRLRRGGER